MKPGAEPANKLLPVTEALDRILSAVSPVTGGERLPLKLALRRILREAVEADVAVPPFANSAMDGWAVRSADIAAGGGLRHTGTSWAGAPFTGEVTPGTCVRIFTGAVLPTGADAVIPQEEARTEGDTVHPAVETLAPGAHVRHSGEDIAVGTRVLEPGTRLDPAQLGLLATVGRGEVAVYRRPRVACLTTGDELRPVGSALAQGQIYDSNRYTLHAMLSRLGVEILDLGVIPDDRTATEQALAEAGRVADLVVSTGGVSVGEADYVTSTLERLGEVNFWKMAMKPGRPLAFGYLGNAWFFGLPGNPVSCMATFYQFVQPALRKLMGEREWTPVRLRVPCAKPLFKAPGRTEFQRGVLGYRHGRLAVWPTGGQESHLLTSMGRANCFVILPAEWGDVPEGEEVEVEPFEGLV